ncbi:MAG TPA: HAD-IIA family hydrolase [Anaerolineaceae bacterium]|nr:HAD-IIA family hydrolase [Anaerolineaceae bacterium]
MNKESEKKNIKALMLDMDGTFYMGDVLLPGALELMSFLNEREIPFSFLTNNSSKSADDYVKKLIGLGVKPEDARVYTSGDATFDYVLREHAGKKVFLMGTQSLRESFEKAGICLVEEDPDLVVLGYDTELTYPVLTRFCDFVRAGLPYLATHPDVNCPVLGGYAPDIGAMMAMIEASTGRKADLILGKPNPGIVEGLAFKWGLRNDEILMVGDRLYTDIMMGKTAGVKTALVLTGEASREDLQSAEHQPDWVVEDLFALIHKLKIAKSC